jgi:ribulose-phosphate 3-epimerase
VRIEVDGGISTATIGAAAVAGADTFVAGSALFGDPAGLGAAVGELRELATAAHRVMPMT